MNRFIEMTIKIYDAVLQLFGLCRYGRYKVAEFHLKLIRSTDQQKAIDGAWKAFKLFNDSMNQQMEQIEKQKSIYFNGRCYRLERDASGDGDKKMFQRPADLLDGHLLMKFNRWMSVHDERELGVSAK